MWWRLSEVIVGIYVFLFVNVKISSFINMCDVHILVMKLSVLYNAVHYGEHNDHWWSTNALQAFTNERHFMVSNENILAQGKYIE